MSDRGLLLIGYGFLGRCFVQQYAHEFAHVYLTSRSAQKLLAVSGKGMTGLRLDINAAESWSSLSALMDRPLAVCCFLTPGQLDVEQFAGFVAYLNNHTICRAVLSSSTVVYGAQTGEVNSDSALSLDSGRAERQHRLEQHWCAGLQNAAIIRLAGLYGPGRIIGQRSLADQRLLPGRADDWLNLIHVRDAAALIKAMLDSDTPGPELGCDDSPVERGQYYTELAAWLGLPGPVFAGDAAARYRRCSNALTRARLDWQPVYPSYREFLTGLQAES